MASERGAVPRQGGAAGGEAAIECSVPEAARRPAPDRITVTAPARLHFGFLDLAFDLGRRFVGLGMAVTAPSTRLTLARTGAGIAADGPEAERALALLEALAHRLPPAAGLHLSVATAIPAHAGLGSGTQLALAVTAAYLRLEHPRADAAALARDLGRGERSAIGLASFETGGVVLDGGRGPATVVPPVIARLPFPEDWRVLLVRDAAAVGVHGAEEGRAFADLPPFPPEASAELCRLVLVRALPALAEGDFDGFASVIGTLQRRVGDHFAAAQGGRFASPRVAEVLERLEREGHAGIGQTSWGPTGFCLFADAEAAEAAARGLRRRYAGLGFDVVQGRNTGAVIEEG